jgi:CRISPR system Cascade subunit CasC
MTAAAEVAHPFTVDRAQVEADFYVAKDDLKPADEDLGAGFMGEQGFSAGLFYGYANIDMNQLIGNLGGDASLAYATARSFIRAALTVSPSGKKASFGSNANATWAMVERGTCAPRSLAGAFLRPVTGEDHHAEAVQRAEKLSIAMSTAYDEDWKRASMDLFAGRGSLRELLGVVDGTAA